jgi:hypothetical protein
VPKGPRPRSCSNFGTPVHCVRIANDGLVYVCDRLNNRVQVFRKDGTFVKEFSVAPRTAPTARCGTSSSRATRSSWLHLADGRNNQVVTLERDSGQVVQTLGRPGRYAGEFHWVHDLAIDSKGNLYAGEVDTGKRVQRFVSARWARDDSSLPRWRTTASRFGPEAGLSQVPRSVFTCMPLVSKATGDLGSSGGTTSS